MRIHHPRMFRREAFYRTEGVNPSLESSVDYDLCLKLIEQGLPWHVQHHLYLYRVNHGANISLARDLQKVNGAFIQELSRVRTSAEPKKEAYFLDEAEGVQYFNFIQPGIRLERLIEGWDKGGKQEGTKLHLALVRELEKLNHLSVITGSHEAPPANLLDTKNLGNYTNPTERFYEKRECTTEVTATL